jgi:hypothetical protein
MSASSYGGKLVANLPNLWAPFAKCLKERGPNPSAMHVSTEKLIGEGLVACSNWQDIRSFTISPFPNFERDLSRA